MVEILSKEPWSSLNRWTSARIALGRAGVSMPTQALLAFNLDHASARDAVQATLNTEQLRKQLRGCEFGVIEVRSKVSDRTEFLRRPDYGTQLHPDSRTSLKNSTPNFNLLTIVIADGLSAQAVANHALPLLKHLREGLRDWHLDDIVIASQARVALADEIGEIRGAEAVILFIGERPGLKSPHSLGAYFTYSPHIGRTDSERNCVSNIRPEGLSYRLAANKLLYLLEQARNLGKSGILLKDDSDLACNRLAADDK